MMNTLRILTLLAWRNLWRNHRRTLIMLGAVVIGVWAMIFLTITLIGASLILGRKLGALFRV